MTTKISTPEPKPVSQPELSHSYDAIIIGGGPSGSTTASLTAEHGHNVLLLERALFPRFHVGESLIPETYWTLKRLGLLETLKDSAFPKKYSVQFVSDGYKESAPFYFDEHNPHECSITWQVVRGEFDDMLIETARSKGATVRTDAQVLDVLFDGDRAVGVRVQVGEGAGKSVHEIHSKIIVDATGQSAFLANRLGLKTPDKILKMGTVWTYFRGAQRDPGKDEGATLIMQTEGKKSWFWYIPLPNDLVSIGCTGPLGYMFSKDRGSAEDVFQAELKRCPALEKRLTKATRDTDYFTTKDFSYRAKQAAGPGWVLVGDAFGFIDPVYSSGVYLALKSGELAADAIHESLAAGDLSAESLGRWQTDYVHGLEMFRKLVYAFYTPDFSFATFLRQHPEYKGHLVDILIGNVFRPGLSEIFEAMGDVVPPSMTAAP
jgi:flavin-dependent dehydrogenase